VQIENRLAVAGGVDDDRTSTLGQFFNASVATERFSCEKISTFDSLLLTM
jgi:hypothetical protein